MKKWLAILSAMMLLLCAVPVTVATVSAEQYDGNLLSFGDFEVSYGYEWDYYQGTYVYGGAALHGNNGAKLQGYGGWGALLEQTVPVNLGQAYHLEFWFKVIQNGFNWRLEQGGAEGLYETRWETATEWTHVSYDFVASSEWVTLNFCGSGNGISEVAYLDDVVISPVVSSDYDGYITNGDFERGDDSGWSPYQFTYFSTDAALNGEYGAHMQGDGGWGALLEQSFPTTPGTEYTVMFFYQVNQNGFNVQIKSSTGFGALTAAWFTATEWDIGVLTFVADGNHATITFCGGGNGIPEDAYVDDVYVIAADGGFDLGNDLADDDYRKWAEYGYVSTCSASAAFEDGVGIHARGYGEGGPILERTFATIEGTEYLLSFLYQNNKEDVGFACIIEDGITHEELYSNTYGGMSWEQEEITFTATSGTTVLRFVGDGGVETEGFYREDFYLDQMYLDAYDEEPAPVQEIKNGGFEHDKFLGWSVYQGTGLSPFAAANGSTGALLQGDGGWGALLEQGFFTDPDGEYELTFSYKVLSNGFNVQILDGSDGSRLTSDWYTAKEWTQVTIAFTAASGTTRLNFCGGGNGIPESAYIDDVVLTRVGGEIPDDPDVPDFPDISYEEIAAGETQEVTVPEEMGVSFLMFTPVESGWYAFTSDGDCDTYIIVGDENGESAVFNDNDGEDDNFRAVAYCVADTPYLLLLTTKAFSGTFDVTVDAVETDALFPDALSIAYGDTAVVEQEQMGVSQVFCFVPEFSGTYILTSNGDADTYCFLYDVEGTAILSFDDEFTEEDNYNFGAAYDCVAGNTYYFLVSSYDEEAVSFTVDLTAEEEPPTPDKPDTEFGDADGNGKINNRDLAVLQQYLNGWDVVIDLAACDVNNDGKINNRDLARLQQYLNGWDVELG